MPLIVVDGDSVSLGTRPVVPEDKTWAHLLAHRRGATLLNLSTPEATVAHGIANIPKVLNANPSWYISQFGEWSLFRRGGPDKENVEPLRHFTRNYEILIRTMQHYNVEVCLVTPPPQLYHEGFAADAKEYTAAVRELAFTHGTHLLDASALMAADAAFVLKDEVDSWFDVPARECLHYSMKGHALVASYFEMLEHREIGT